MDALSPISFVESVGACRREAGKQGRMDDVFCLCVGVGGKGRGGVARLFGHDAGPECQRFCHGGANCETESVEIRKEKKALQPRSCGKECCNDAPEADWKSCRGSGVTSASCTQVRSCAQKCGLRVCFPGSSQSWYFVLQKPTAGFGMCSPNSRSAGINCGNSRQFSKICRRSEACSTARILSQHDTSGEGRGQGNGLYYRRYRAGSHR